MIHLFQEVFYLVIIIGFVSRNNRRLWDIEGKMLQGIDIPKATMGQKKLDRLAIFGHHQMDLESIELSFLAGNIAAKLFVRVERGVLDPDMVTCRNRSTIHHIYVVMNQGFPDVPSQFAQENQRGFQPMESATKAALTQHLGHIGMWFEHPASTFKIPTKEERRRKGRRQHLGSAHLTLRVFVMLHGV
jgi:hypothetical protein